MSSCLSEKAVRAAQAAASVRRNSCQLLALAASHPAVLDFILCSLRRDLDVSRGAQRLYMREYWSRGYVKEARRKRVRAAAARGRPNPAAWPAVVWLHFLDAVIAQGRKDEQAEEATACRRTVREGLKLLEALFGQEEFDRLTRRFDRRKHKSKPQVRVLENLRERLRLLVRKRNVDKAGPARVLIGCPVHQLQEHLEKQFTPEMNWDNYGSYWHVDHIRPCASFDLSRREEQHRCFHFSNLQPLEGRENVRKGATYAGN